jgi:hypothetical protein
MSASDQVRAESPEAEFWDRLDRLEGRHLRVQSQYDDARRGLERTSSDEAEEVQRAWRHYCEVIAELDQTTSEFEALHR